MKLTIQYHHLILTRRLVYRINIGSVFNKSYNFNIPILSISSHISSSLSSYPTTPDVLRKFLCLLPSKFNNSPDGIPKEFLKKLSFELCHPLSIIFTNILDSRICPDIWKISHIIPIFKKGDATKPANYRPISFLPSTLILFEKILSHNLTFYLHNYITKFQYGIRPNCNYYLFITNV